MFRSNVKTVPLIFIVDNNSGIVAPAVPSNKYSVALPSTYKDIVSIELIQASISVDANTDYVTLNVNNYSRTLGNATHLNSSFCTILNDYSVTGANEKIIYKRAGSQPDESYIYYFSEPAKLSRLNIEILSTDGTTLDDARHILIFEIRSLAQARF